MSTARRWTAARSLRTRGTVLEDGNPLDRRTVTSPRSPPPRPKGRAARPGLTVRVEGPPTPVDADARRIAQVLANLLENARRHSPPEGTVRISVAREGSLAVLEVADEGPGILPADRDRVFDRLVRLDEARTRDAGGARLGLPIARALARAHGGDLRAVAAETGARLRLVLPAAGGEPTGADVGDRRLVWQDAEIALTD